jgi:hypothetical protein
MHSDVRTPAHAMGPENGARTRGTKLTLSGRPSSRRNRALTGCGDEMFAPGLYRNDTIAFRRSANPCLTGIAGSVTSFEEDPTLTYPRPTAFALVLTALLVVPLSSASAHRYHGGPFFWPFAAAAAVVGAAVAVASAPFAAIAAPPAYYTPPPPPNYAPPAYYAPPPGYYAPGYYYGR